MNLNNFIVEKRFNVTVVFFIDTIESIIFFTYNVTSKLRNTTDINLYYKYKESYVF